MDRWLQKVSMDAGRENEGPYETRLITNLEGIASVRAVEMADAIAGYSQDEARSEAGRCLQCQCLECVKACAFLESFGGYPKPMPGKYTTTCPSSWASASPTN